MEVENVENEGLIYSVEEKVNERWSKVLVGYFLCNVKVILGLFCKI